MEYIYFEAIEDLCRNKTDLNELEISYLKDIMFAILLDDSHSDRDIFIDVRDKASGEGLVVFHRYPITGYSSYEINVVGDLAFRKDEPGALRTLDTGKESINLLAQTQEGKIITQDILPIKLDGKVIGVIISEKEILDECIENTDVLKPMEPTLKTPSVLMESFLFDNLSDAILVFDSTGMLHESNRAAKVLYNKFGYLNPLSELHFDNLTLDRLSFDQVKQQLDLSKVPILEKWTLFNDVIYSQKMLYLADKNLYLVTLTELNTQMPVSESNNLIDTVEVQEIHHRVKNSLQSIISILRLQSRRVQSPEARAAFQESVNRVMAISATHELLSKQTHSTVQLSLVLERVITQLKRVYGRDREVSIKVHLDEKVVLRSDATVTLALIINEIIQNSFEHAFTEMNEDDQPEIEISLDSKDSVIHLTVTDNGKGFDPDQMNYNSLGLRIIQAFTEDKLKGTCQYKSAKGKGTKVDILFDQTQLY